MLSHCPGCGYDLAGLTQKSAPVCPECGDTLDLDTLLARFERSSAHWWILVLVSPLIALPACFAMGIGQPIVAWCLASIFSYQAMRMDEARQGDAPRRSATLWIAMVFAFFWTLLTTTIMATIAMLGVAFLKPV